MYHIISCHICVIQSYALLHLKWLIHHYLIQIECDSHFSRNRNADWRCIIFMSICRDKWKWEKFFHPALLFWWKKFRFKGCVCVELKFCTSSHQILFFIDSNTSNNNNNKELDEGKAIRFNDKLYVELLFLQYSNFLFRISDDTTTTTTKVRQKIAMSVMGDCWREKKNS